MRIFVQNSFVSIVEHRDDHSKMIERACSSASSTKSVCMDVDELTRQPAMRRAKTSTTKATQTKPC